MISTSSLRTAITKESRGFSGVTTSKGHSERCLVTCADVLHAGVVRASTRRYCHFAHSPVVHVDPPRRPCNSLLNIRIREDDIRTFAPKLQRHLLQIRRSSRPQNVPTSGGRAGEGHLTNAHMVRDRCAHGLTVAGNQVDRTGWEARFFNQLAHFERCQWSRLSRFDYDCVAGDNGGSNLPCANVSKEHGEMKSWEGAHVNINRGKFHGMIWPQTPMGSRRV